MVKKSLIKIVLVPALFDMALGVFAQASRKPWSEVANPKITSVVKDSSDPKSIVVNFDLDTPRDNSGADKAIVEVSAPGVGTKTAQVGKTRNKAKKATIELSSSGDYKIVVKGYRNNEAASHDSEPVAYAFSLPLEKPLLTVLNKGNGTIEASWSAVKEATGYVLSYTINGKTTSNPAVASLSSEIKGLKVGDVASFKVSAVRGNDSSDSDSIKKTIRAEAERVWNFTEFGTSTKPELNNFKILDADNLKVQLNSCTYDPKSGNIIDKGGKYESFFDGMSFYYTKIDPRKENFELTVTVKVDYINPMPDGQEGFGVLALDQLGVDGSSLDIAYNNSTGIVVKKFTTHVNDAKKEVKDGLGYRAVTGITDEIIANGEAAVKDKATSIYEAFSYDSSDTVKTGDVYRVTLKKDNTGYHSIYKRKIASEGTVEEYILYDSKNIKLLQLDPDWIYVGFSVARGCNATFSDVVFKTSDPKNDPPAIPEPPALVPLAVTIDCPTTYTSKSYPFAMITNAKGTVHIEDKFGNVVIDSDPVEANVYYRKNIKIKIPSTNDWNVTFVPENKWAPGENQVIAQYNTELAKYEENYKSVTYVHSVSANVFKGKNLYVSTNGSIFGKGTKDDPIDLDSAIKYLQPGQTALLLPGKYFPTKIIEIERGNDGTAKKRKTLKSADPKNRAVIDFSSFTGLPGAAFSAFGNYWTIEGIDITNSPENCKGLQIGGSYNEIIMVDTYLNKDTGIQISGRSVDSPDLWPHDNLVYGCESFGNCDPAQNNADGFASKLTSGKGNVFRNCVSHHNVDDGWDLYSKVETGAIGEVLVENCIAYANGTKLDLTGKGDGNGFKMGGDGIPVKHILRNSISWGNTESGITCNSNPALILDHVTSYGNAGYNVSLYGKGSADKNPRTFVADGVLSVNGGMGDNFDPKNAPGLANNLASKTNFFFNGSKSLNGEGKEATKDSFADVDIAKWANGYNADGSFNRIPRSEDGVFDLGDLFKIANADLAGVGADYNHVAK